MRNVAYITPGALLLSAGLIVGQLVVARWVDLHPILWPAAPVCALISASALLALFVLPVDAISASRRKLIGRLAFFGLILAAVSSVLALLCRSDRRARLAWFWPRGTGCLRWRDCRRNYLPRGTQILPPVAQRGVSQNLAPKRKQREVRVGVKPRNSGLDRAFVRVLLFCDDVHALEALRVDGSLHHSGLFCFVDD